MNIAIFNMYATLGSTGTIAQGLQSYLKENGHSTLLIYGRENKRKDLADCFHNQSKLEEKLHGVLSSLTGLQGYFSDVGTSRALKKLDAFHPDAVVLINIHSGYLHEERLWKYLASRRIRTVYIMPDEYAMLGNCCYTYGCEEYKTGCKHCTNIHGYPNSLFFDVAGKVVEMKKRAYESMGELLTFVSPKLNIDQAKQSYLLKDKKLVEANWGIDTKRYQPVDPAFLREKYGISEETTVLLAVGSFSDERKGLKKHFLECAKRTTRKDLLFVNVGFDGEREGLPENFLPIPYTKDQNELCALFTLADCTVMPSKGETLPLTCLISLSCGTPLCLFDSAGLSSMGEGLHSRLVKADDTDALLRALEETEHKTQEQQAFCRAYVNEHYLDRKFFETVLLLAKGENV